MFQINSMVFLEYAKIIIVIAAIILLIIVSMDFLLFNFWFWINLDLFVCLSYFRDQTRKFFPWKSSFHWIPFFTKTTVTFSFVIVILIVPAA